jgi:hypothetical protein
MTMLPEGRLRINVARHGGLLGRTLRWTAEAPPRSPAHDAATALLGTDPPPQPARKSPDAFTYDVEITDRSGAALLSAQFHDPIPDALDRLIAAITGPA